MAQRGGNANAAGGGGNNAAGGGGGGGGGQGGMNEHVEFTVKVRPAAKARAISRVCLETQNLAVGRVVVRVGGRICSGRQRRAVGARRGGPAW